MSGVANMLLAPERILLEHEILYLHAGEGLLGAAGGSHQ